MPISSMPETATDILSQTGIKTEHPVHYQETPEQLSAATIERGEGELNDKGALLIKTGEFTGRSPQDKFTVKDQTTADSESGKTYVPKICYNGLMPYLCRHTKQTRYADIFHA